MHYTDSGFTYEGGWKNYDFHGYGIITVRDGKVSYGLYDDGVLVREITSCLFFCVFTAHFPVA
jgi:hypothetical protein